jgi:hypothetical protein
MTARPSAFPPRGCHLLGSSQPANAPLPVVTPPATMRPTTVLYTGLALYAWLRKRGFVTQDTVKDACIEELDLTEGFGLNISKYAKYNNSLSDLSYKTSDDSLYKSIVSEHVPPQANHQGDRAPGQRAVSPPYYNV